MYIDFYVAHPGNHYATEEQVNKEVRKVVKEHELGDDYKISPVENVSGEGTTYRLSGSADLKENSSKTTGNSDKLTNSDK